MEQEESTFKKILKGLGYLVGGVITLAIIGGWLSGGSSGSSYSGSSYDYEDEEMTIDSYDAKSDYWDEIAEYIDGTYTLEACSDSSGNCYDLDADISGGTITTLYFDNGGYLDFSADLDSDGSASDYDYDGNGWEFALDESYIDEAVESWADTNGYNLE